MLISSGVGVPRSSEILFTIQNFDPKEEDLRSLRLLAY
jgi:hypothetical protein